MVQTSLAPSTPTISLHPQHILVFDSGLGGLSVLREITRQVPSADVTYVADDAGFPYGNWQEPALVDHIVALMGDLIDGHRPDLVVIACNTASTLVLPPLRARYTVPFVGTVPAIKPAAEATRTGLVSVLATPGTVARDYTRQLIDRFARDAQVTLVGSTRLAAITEDWLRGVPVDMEAILAEIAPCFVEVGGKRTDTIVLGCTHYPLLIDPIRRMAPWDVHWIDGAEAIARRACGVLGAPATKVGERPDILPIRYAIFTSGKPVGNALSERLAEFGFQRLNESRSKA